MTEGYGVSQQNHAAISLASPSVRAVSQQQPRRPRGATKDYIGLFARVQPENHAKAHQMAARLGISLGDLVDQLVQQAPVDDDGRPLWAEEPARQELPLAG